MKRAIWIAVAVVIAVAGAWGYGALVRQENDDGRRVQLLAIAEEQRLDLSFSRSGRLVTRVVAEFVGAQPAASVGRFLDSLAPSQAEILAQRGDEDSLRQAVELEPSRTDAALPLARILHARGQHQEALDVLSGVHGSFAADGLAARIRLEISSVPDLDAAFAALDAGNHERALDLLISAIKPARRDRDDIRRVVVAVLDKLGLEDPLATTSRARLASALY